MLEKSTEFMPDGLEHNGIMIRSLGFAVGQGQLSKSESV